MKLGWEQDEHDHLEGRLAEKEAQVQELEHRLESMAGSDSDSAPRAPSVASRRTASPRPSSRGSVVSSRAPSRRSSRLGFDPRDTSMAKLDIMRGSVQRP